MTCKKAKAELVAFIDGELRERQKMKVAAHVEGCPSCRRELGLLAEAGRLLSKLERVQPSEHFEPDFWRKTRFEEEKRLRWPQLLSGWRLAPALAALGLVLVVSYLTFLSDSHSPDVPERLKEEPGFFLNNELFVQMDKLAQWQAVSRGTQEALPPKLRKEPNLFVNYPLLKRLDQLEHFEAVLQVPLGRKENGRA